MSKAQIKVTTEELVAKAEIVRNKVSAMKTQIDEAEKLMDKTAAYWIGDAGDKKRKDFKAKKKNAEQIIKRLSEYPDDLMEMAGVYVAAEQENTERPAALPTNFIM